MLAYLNTNNSAFSRISRAARHGPRAFSVLLIYLQLSQGSVYQPIGLGSAGTEWISEGLLGDDMKNQCGHENLTLKK